MTSTVTTSNVYYLPLRRETPDEVVRRRPARATVWTRTTRAWWRLRFSCAEIWSIIRRTTRYLFSDGDTALVDRAEFERFDRFETSRRGPARIIDFAAAKQRLRPALV
jgi:hypothetical protein